MQINKKKLEGVKVYALNADEPCGKVADVCISEKKKCIDFLIVESMSLIPISKKIPMTEIHVLTDKKIVLKHSFSEYNVCTRDNESIFEKDIIGAKINNNRMKKISDIKFIFETGEITDVLIKKNVFTKSESIKVSDLKIRNNIFYIIDE